MSNRFADPNQFFDTLATPHNPYAAHGNVTTRTLRDPRALRAMREEFEARGQKFENDEDMVRAFMKDRTWAGMNTGSSALDALRVNNSDVERRQRQRYLQELWNAVPNPWEEGGRPWGEALYDNVSAAVLDPINAVPVLSAYKKAMLAGRAAQAAGQSAVRAGVKAGARTGAIMEGAVGGAAEGIIDSTTQMRDTQLGLQDGFSGGQLAGAVGVGATIGAGMGGLIGAGTGIFGGRAGARQADELGRLGFPSADIGSMPAPEAELAVQSGTPYQPPAPPPPDPNAKPPTAQEVFLKGMEEKAVEIDAALRAAREEVVELRADGASAEVVADAQARVDQLARLRQMPTRFANEQKEIDGFQATSDPERNAEGARRRAMFERDLEDFQLALRSNDLDEIAATVQRLEAPVEQRLLEYKPREDGVTASVDQPIPGSRPMGEAPDGSGVVPMSARATQPSAGPDAPPAPPPEPLRYANDAARKLATDLGEETVRGYLERGLLAPGPKGINKGQLQKAIKEAAKGQPEEGAQPSAATETPAERVVPPNLKRFRGELLRAGVDPSTVTGTGVNGKLIREDIDRIISQTEEASEYARGIKEDVQRIIDQAALQNVDDELIEQFLDMTARLDGDPQRAEDVVAFYKRISSLDDEARASISDESFTNTERQRIERLARVERRNNPGLSLDDARMLARAEVMAQRADASGGGQPRTASGEKIEPRTFQRNNERLGSSAAVERSNLYTTAGKTKAGRISELLKSGMATSKKPKQEIEEYYRSLTGGENYADRTVTNTGLGPGEQAYQGKSTYSREAAHIQAKTNVARNNEIVAAKNRATSSYSNYAARAIELGLASGKAARALYDAVAQFYDPSTKTLTRSAGDLAKAYIGRFAAGTTPKDAKSVINSLAVALRNEQLAQRDLMPEIVPYVTTTGERVTGMNGEVPKGTELWVDARTGRTYKSMAEAMYARGDLKKQSPAEQMAEGLDPADAPSGGGINEFLRNLPPDADPEQALAQLRKLLGREEPTPAAAPEPPPSRDGDLLMLRSKTDPSKIRLLSPKQVDNGTTARDLLGASNPADWEARYLPRSQHTWDKSKYEQLWDSVEGQTEAPTPELTVPVSYAEYTSRPLENLTPEERAAIEYGWGLGGAGGSPPQTGLIGGHLEQAVFRLEHGSRRSLFLDANDFDNHIAQLETLYALQARIAPEGFVKPSQTRSEAIAQLEDLLSGYDTTTQVEARRLMERLASGGRAPRLEENAAGKWEYGFHPLEGDSILVPRADSRASMPPLAKLYHEVMHWSWYNILTPQDRLEALQYFRKTFYNEKGALDADGVRSASSYDPVSGGGASNSMDNIGEFVADQFSQWAMRSRTGPAAREEGLWSRLANYVKAVMDRYLFGRPIDADLERLFSKVLPDDARLQLQNGRADPQTKFGEAVQRRYREMAIVRNDMEDALRSGSGTRIVEAARQLRDYLNSVSMSKGTAAALARRDGTNPRTSGPLSPFNAMVRRVRERTSDLYEVIEGKGLPDEYIRGEVDLDPDLFEGASVSSRSPEEIANFLADIYDNGHAPSKHGSKGYSPVGYVPDGDIESTPIRQLLDDMEATLESAFMRAENSPLRSHEPARPPKPTPEGEPALRAARGRAQAAQDKQREEVADAIRTAKTEPKKRDTKRLPPERARGRPGQRQVHPEHEPQGAAGRVQPPQGHRLGQPAGQRNPAQGQDRAAARQGRGRSAPDHGGAPPRPPEHADPRPQRGRPRQPADRRSDYLRDAAPWRAGQAQAQQRQGGGWRPTRGRGQRGRRHVGRHPAQRPRLCARDAGSDDPP
jgi:hypothetical protein